MKEDLTELVFILDRSGSMAGLEADTIGGFNAMLEKQKNAEGRALVSTVLFSGEAVIIHDRVPVENVEPLTAEDYCVGGCTALLDAVGGAVRHIANVHRYARPEDVPAHTLFVITTDGMENASRIYSGARVQRMVEHEKAKYGWEFLFLGANIDAAETAGHLGIDAGRAVNYNRDHTGTRLNFDVVGEAIYSVRSNEPVPDNWSARIDEDYKKRR
jgi:uncharacterized protein YegL